MVAIAFMCRAQGPPSEPPMSEPHTTLHALGGLPGMTDHIAEFPDGGFVVVSTDRHEHWPPKGTPLTLKAVLRGSEEYLVGQDRHSIGPGRYLLVQRDDPYGSRVTSPEIAMCPLFFESQTMGEMGAFLYGLSEDRLLDGVQGRLDFQTTLLPRNRDLDRLCGRIWAATRRLASETDPWSPPHPIEASASMELELLSRQALSLALASRHCLHAWLKSLHVTRVATREEIHRRLARAEDRMHGELDRPLSLAGLARTACMSPFHFARRFTELHGEPPHRFLTRLRLIRARTLIEETDMPLREVARRCGYQSLPTFIRICKQAWGCTPGALRGG